MMRLEFRVLESFFQSRVKVEVTKWNVGQTQRGLRLTTTLSYHFVIRALFSFQFGIKLSWGALGKKCSSVFQALSHLAALIYTH